MAKPLSTKNNGIPYAPTQAAVVWKVRSLLKGVHQPIVCAKRIENAAAKRSPVSGAISALVITGSRRRPTRHVAAARDPRRPRRSWYGAARVVNCGRERL